MTPPLMNSPTGEPPAGSVVMLLPELPQRSLFGSNALGISVSEVLSWHGGIAPAGIQQALRHEMQRRCLRHADVADRVGVSRSQFENILQGRFGASPAVAAQIRDFLIEGAETVGTSV